MAGDWIKIETGLGHKPEVVALAAALGLDRDAVVGKLVTFWSWADQHYDERDGASVTAAYIDELVRAQNFAENLKKVGWLKGENLHFTIPKFDRHMSESAKKRARDMRRKKLDRARTKSGQNPDPNRTRDRGRDRGEVPPVPPPVAEVIAFGAAWPGDAATGCPPGIPEDFCRNFHARTTDRAQWLGPAGKPRNWRGQFATWWKRDFRTWGQFRGGARNGTHSGTGAEKAFAREASGVAGGARVLA